MTTQYNILPLALGDDYYVLARAGVLVPPLREVSTGVDAIVADVVELSDSVLGDVLIGTITWGHVSGVSEDYAKTLSLWTGTGAASGSGDAESISLRSGQYMESPTWHIGSGSVRLREDVYGSGSGAATIQYKQGSSKDLCEADTWHDYSGVFSCDGWIKIKVSN